MAKRGRKPQNELQELSAGLDQVADPYGIKPLLPIPTSELAEKVNAEFRYTVVSMIRAGRYLIAIKEKEGHGGWIPFVNREKWSWEFVRTSIKFVEIAARFPQAVHIPPGRIAHQICHLPMGQIEEILQELPEAAIKRLTPSEWQRIYEAKKQENKKALSGAPDASLQPPLSPDSITLSVLFQKARSALRKMAELKISPEDYELARKYQDQLEADWNFAAYNLRDPEHETTPPWKLYPTGKTEFGTEASITE